MEVPEHVPEPQAVMMAGFLDFGSLQLHQIMFWAACAMVVLGIVLYVRTREDVAKNLLVVQVFFDVAAFPIIKKMTGVLSCTGADKWMVDADGVAQRACSLALDAVDLDEAQCMDEAPTLQCWDSEHLLYYVAPVMVFLAPYYILCVDLQSASQAKQSIVVIDRICGIVSFQSKFILAFIASTVGDCYPWVMVGAVEFVVLFQLVLITWDRDYTSVLLLNGVRVAGLAMASVNGFYASFVVYMYQDTPGAGAGACVTYDTQPNATAPAVNTEDGSTSASTNAVQSYSVFFGLLGCNLVAAAFGVRWYLKRRKGWVPQEREEGLEKGEVSQESEMALQVDYPILKRRLKAVTDKLSSAGPRFEGSYDRFKAGFDKGRQMAQIQAIWEWADAEGKGTLDVHELERLASEVGETGGVLEALDLEAEEPVTELAFRAQLAEKDDTLHGWFDKLKLLPRPPNQRTKKKMLEQLIDAHTGEEEDKEMCSADFECGLGSGLSWVPEPGVHFGKDGERAKSYWNESPSEAAWSKAKTFYLAVSEYDEEQKMQGIHKLHMVIDSGDVDEDEDEEGAPADGQESSSGILGKTLSSVTSIGKEGIGDRLSGAAGDIGAGIMRIGGAVERRIDRAVSNVKEGIEDLANLDIDVAEAVGEQLDKLQGHGAKIQRDTNLIARLAELSHKTGANEEKNKPAAGQQIEKASLEMVLHEKGEKRPMQSTTTRRGRRLSVRRASLGSLHHQPNTPTRHGIKDPHQGHWRMRVAVQDIDLSTAGGLLFIKRMRKLHERLGAVASKGESFWARWKGRMKGLSEESCCMCLVACVWNCFVGLAAGVAYLLRPLLWFCGLLWTKLVIPGVEICLCTSIRKEKSLTPAIVHSLRIKRMPRTDDVPTYAPVIFSPFLRIETVDLHGCRIREGFRSLVQALPGSGIRTLDVSYCKIGERSMASFIKTLVFAQSKDLQDDDAEHPSRSCCSICHASGHVDHSSCAKPLAAVGLVEWRWLDERCTLAAPVWQPATTRSSLFDKELKKRANQQRPIAVRWHPDAGQNDDPCELECRNRRELEMAWPDQQARPVCERCGLPTSPNMGGSHEGRAGKWSLGSSMQSLTSLNIVGNPIQRSCQDMIHLLEDNPQLTTLCGLEPGKREVRWSPSPSDPRRRSLVDTVLLAADIRVRRAAAKVQSVDISCNHLFPRLNDADISTPDDVDLEMMQWRYVCLAFQESSRRVAGLEKFRAFDVGLIGPAAEILARHGLQRQTAADDVLDSGLSELHLELNPLGQDGGEAVARLITQPAGQVLRKIIVGGSEPAHICVNDAACTSLDLSGAFLEPGEILIVAAAIPTLPMLEHLEVGEEETDENPHPHPHYILDAAAEEIHLTEPEYKGMYAADLVLLSRWIEKPNVAKTLQALSLRSTGLRGRRTKQTDPCQCQQAIETDRPCAVCRFREYIREDPNDLDPFCFTLHDPGSNPVLDLSGKFLGPADCKILASWLSSKSAYTAVLLGRNFISGSQPHRWDRADADVSGLAALGSVIPKMQALQELDLSSNLLGCDALLAFASAGGLQVPSSFRVLNIADNRLDSEGWRDFIELCANDSAHMGENVSVIARRNPILWRATPERPILKKGCDRVATFSMKTAATYTGLADEPDETKRIALHRIIEDAEDNGAPRAVRLQDRDRGDTKTFKVEGSDEMFSEQEVVQVEADLSVWENTCKQLLRVKFGALDISDVGMASDPHTLDAMRMLAGTIVHMKLTVLTLDNTSSPSHPVRYTLSANETFEAIKRPWEPRIGDEHPWKTIDLSESELGEDDAVLLSAWLQLPGAKHVVHRLLLGHSTSDTQHGSTSIGVRGKFELAKVLGGWHQLRSGSQDSVDGWDPEEAPRNLESVQIDIADVVVRLRSEQTSIPDPDWVRLKTLEGMTVADVVFLTGWLRSHNVRNRLRKLSAFSTGSGADGTPIPYTLGTDESQDEEGNEEGNEEESLVKKNLGPADSGLVAAWLALPDVSKRLTSLDLSDNEYLFDFSRNADMRSKLKMRSFESWTAFCRALGESSLTTLRISSTQMGPTAAVLLFEEASKLEILDVRGNPLATMDTPEPTDVDDSCTAVAVVADRLRAVSALRRLIQRSQALTELDASECQLDAEALLELATPSQDWEDTGLRKLHLAGNPATTSAGAAIAREDTSGTKALCAALHAPELKVAYLDMSGCGMGGGSADALADALGASGLSKSLRTLRLANNPLGGLGKDSLPDHSQWWQAPAAASGDALAKLQTALQRTHLTELDIGYCGLGPAKIKAVSLALSAADSVIRSDLSTLKVIGNPLSGTFWEKDERWCCACSKCHRKCKECKVSVAEFGIPEERRRLWCRECARWHNTKHAAEQVDRLEAEMGLIRDADEDYDTNREHRKLKEEQDMWKKAPPQRVVRDADWTDCQTVCQPNCPCRMQYDTDVSGLQELAVALCGSEDSESHIRDCDISGCRVGAIGMLAFCGAVKTIPPGAVAPEDQYKSWAHRWRDGQPARSERGLALRGWAPRLVERTESSPVSWTLLDGRGTLYNTDDQVSVAVHQRTPGATGQLCRLTVDSTGVVGYPVTYTLDAKAPNICLENKSLGPADAELLACWLSKPDVDATAKALKLNDNPSLIGQVWVRSAPPVPGEEQLEQDEMDEFHGQLAQPDDSDGVEGFRVLCNGQRSDQPHAIKRGLEKTSIHELHLGNIGLGSFACQAFCDIVSQRTDFSDGIEELVLPKNAVGLDGGRAIASVIDANEGLQNLKAVVLANNARIPIHDDAVTSLDFTRWLKAEDTELRRFAGASHDPSLVTDWRSDTGCPFALLPSGTPDMDENKPCALPWSG